MKNNRMKVVFGMAAVSVIAAAAISLTGGCKSQPVKEEPLVPAPVSAQPVAAQPVVASQPAVAAKPVANVAPAPVQAEAMKYTVQKGDSFAKIAKNHGVTMQELAKYNNMSLEKPLRIGVTLKIPPKAAK